MTHRFAAEFTFQKEGGDIEYVEGSLVCSHWAVSDTVNLEAEVFMPIVVEDTRVKDLEDGWYHCYVSGELEFSQSENHDTWSRDTEYIFVAEEKDVSFFILGKAGAGE